MFICNHVGWGINCDESNVPHSSHMSVPGVCYVVYLCIVNCDKFNKLN